jgi:hypothetical protein
VRKIEDSWSLLQRFDYYYLFEEGPMEFKSISQRSNLMALSDSLFYRCIFKGIAIPSFVDRITERWNGIDYDVHELAIPSSIQVLEGSSVFFGFSALKDLRLAINSQIIIIDGFRECKSLFQVSIPVSVEVISGFVDVNY